MTNIKFKAGRILINILISVVISLIVNFSYFIFIVLSYTAQNPERPNTFDGTVFAVIEMLFYTLFAFALLQLFTHRLDDRKTNSNSFPKRLLFALTVSIVVYLVAPVLTRHDGLQIVILSRRVFNPMVLLKCSFALVVTALYGKIYELIMLQQRIILENERLKTENLRSRYDALISQMNPHFFFNSLNSLSMLVRENKSKDASEYIDRLSDTFRYIIESGRKRVTTLREEIAFLDAYKYLLEMRYAGKLFIEVDVPPEYLDRMLPSLTLQPLVENAVKHNTITCNKPLTITISAHDDYLMVGNPIQPKVDDSERGTGMGLKNIASRYRLLTDTDINIIDDGRSFVVRLPLRSGPIE